MKLINTALFVSSVLLLAACSDNKEPAECTQYFALMDACVTKIADGNPELAKDLQKTFQIQKQGILENEAFKNLNKQQQGQACKVDEEIFKQQAATIGC